MLLEREPQRPADPLGAGAPRDPDAGYTGYLSSEYEGEREPWRSIEQVRRQHSLMRQVADAI